MIETHECEAEGCKAACPRDKFMCLPHWRMVPAPLQREVYGAYRAFLRVKKPPEAVRAAIKRLREAHAMAITSVREKEIKRQLRREEGQHPLIQ